MSPDRVVVPRPDDETRAYFASIVPDAPGVAVRPMFGNLAAFANGNMFMGLFGNDVFVRLGEADRTELHAAGGAELSPMPGRPMREYLVLPPAWRAEPSRVQGWVGRSLAFAAALPPKQAKPRKRRAAERQP